MPVLLTGLKASTILGVKRALLLGLDGATFDLLDAYARQGLLPGYSRWLEQGAAGVLTSTNPPTTPPAWSSCVTGMNPGRHGVFDFRESFHSDPSRPLITGSSIRARKIWDILGERTRRSCITNFPVGFPPEPTLGVFVCGMMTPDSSSDYASPPGELARLLEAVPGYVPNVDIPAYDADQLDNALVFLDDLERSLEARIAAFWHYFEREDWDFYFPTFVFHDRLGHLFWKFMTGEDGFDQHPHFAVLRPRIERLYRMFDDLLVRLLDERPADLTLLMCSDHGFGGTRTHFEVNAWLEHLGLLVLKPRSRLRSRAFYAAMEFGESEPVRGLLPEGLQSRVRRKIRSGRSSFKEGLLDSIDWTKTRAFFPGVPLQGIVLPRASRATPAGFTTEEGRVVLRDELRAQLESLPGPDGSPVIDRVWNREELYRGPYTDLAPDLIFVAQNYSCLGRPVLGARSWFRDSQSGANGFHRMGGVILALGEGVRAGVRIADSSIEGITPTVLHAMGEAVPDDLDGKIARDLFEPKWLRSHPPRYCDAGDFVPPAAGRRGEDDEGLKDRLRALGYLD